MRQAAFRGMLLGLAMSAPAFSLAIVAYSNFGPNDELNNSQGNSILGNAWEPSFQQQSIAYQFTSLESGAVSKLVLGIFHFHSRIQGIDPTTNEVKVSLMLDSGADKVGSLMKSWIVSGMPEFLQSTDTTSVVDDSGQVLLASGQKYWLLIEGSVIDSGASWNWTTQDISGMEAVSHDYFENANPTYSYSDSRQCAFRVEVESVPEPVVGLLLLPLAFLARKRRIRT